MDNSNISNNLLYTQMHFDLLIELYKSSFESNEDLVNVYNTITETAVKGLNIDRASFWSIKGDTLICVNLFDKKSNKHSIESDLKARDFPKYFKALKEGIAIVADDALTNEYTSELKENYLIPLGITDMLDLPIRENGVLIGVLCCEHRDEPRVWSKSDLAFARSLSDILSILIEQNKRRIIEKELLESQRKLSLITNNSSDGFVVFENKILTYLSPSYSNMLGYEEHEAMNFSLEDVFNAIHPEDVEKVRTTIYKNISDREKSFKCQFRFRGKSGDYFWREDTASVLYNDDGNYDKYIIISRDISAMKKAENEISKLFTVTKNLNERLLDFTHIISHNIRSNTSNMTMILDLIEATNDQNEKDEYFQLLKECNFKLTDTIYYLNETVNIQLSSKEHRSKLNLKSEIEKILLGINAIVLNNKAHININIPDFFEINTIPSYFESIILNLVTNAIKYKSNERELVIDIDVENGNSQFSIFIKDNGLGINMARNKDKIFGMYKTFHGNSDAVGLGLFMTKNHIEALGGTIEVTSEVGCGSEFKFTLYE